MVYARSAQVATSKLTAFGNGPVTVSPVITSTSDIFGPASNAYPIELNKRYKFDTGAPMDSTFREVDNVRVPANYGGIASGARYGSHRFRHYDGIGSTPGPIPTPDRPMWNNAVAVVYAKKPISQQTTQHAKQGNLLKQAMAYSPPSGASLNSTPTTNQSAGAMLKGVL